MIWKASSFYPRVSLLIRFGMESKFAPWTRLFIVYNLEVDLSVNISSQKY